jgi:hypothetical protein
MVSLDFFGIKSGLIIYQVLHPVEKNVLEYFNQAYIFVGDSYLDWK